MGASNSTEAGAGAFRIFHITKNGPADKAGLEMFFEFIVGAEGIILRDATIQARDAFLCLIKTSANKPIKLQVYSARTLEQREVTIVPEDQDGFGVLGAVVRYDLFDYPLRQGVRVMEIKKNSPAFLAGLIPFKDYIIACETNEIRNPGDVIDALNCSLGHNLLFYVYNSQAQKIREVTIHPKLDWGGSGCIGCDIGSGCLHRIPITQTAPAQESVTPANTPLTFTTPQLMQHDDVEITTYSTSIPQSVTNIENTVDDRSVVSLSQPSTELQSLTPQMAVIASDSISSTEKTIESEYPMHAFQKPVGIESKECNEMDEPSETPVVQGNEQSSNLDSERTDREVTQESQNASSSNIFNEISNATQTPNLISAAPNSIINNFGSGAPRPGVVFSHTSA